MRTKYELEKIVWSEEDFDHLAWRDCTIHALAFPLGAFDLLLDIDYIFEWISPVEPERNYQFWIAPVTLAFENVHEIKIDFDICDHIQIGNIEREKATPRESEYIHRFKEWNWDISCTRGDITFLATGFKMFARTPPLLAAVSRLDPAARGGYSFDRRFRELDP